MAGSAREILRQIRRPNFETSKSTSLKSTEQLEKLTEGELYKYICGPILDAENKAYTKERNTGLHKLVFLVGGPHKDIARVRDELGNSVYINPPKYAKAPEIIEAIVAASNYLNKIDKKPTRFYSEIADVAHNLALLTVLDPEAKQPYRNEEITYQDCLKGLAKSLNLEVRDLLLLAAIKYTKRLEGNRKNTHAEDKLIKEAIEKSTIPYPTIDQVGKAYGAINIIGNCILLPRLNYLAEKKGWDLSVSSRNSNHIFK